MNKLIECVPNFSEGRDMSIIKQITDAIESVDGVNLLDVDPGAATNRTVVTFVGHPDAVIKGAFEGIKKAAELIDMSKHKGEHPRFGATDVCPLVPISGIEMEEVVEYAKKLGERVGNELDIPVYLYESAASKPERKNLATVRAGEYEGIEEKIKKPEWKPDYGQAQLNAKTGNVAIGARNFLVAYNINLNTTSVRRANSIAFDVREQGRVKREGNPITGKVVNDENGNPVRIPGKLKGVKGIGWYIEEYGVAQVSMNITDITVTKVHEVFEACRDSANNRGMRVSGSEVIGLVPKSVLVDAGKFYLARQNRSTGIAESELIKIAVKSMGLDDLTPFDPQQKVIEYQLEKVANSKLVSMNLKSFAEETASESPAPGGGSISAYMGALGVSLGTMVANLSSHKRGWDDRWESFSQWAERGQILQNDLIKLVDEDTNAFNKIMDAFKLPKGNDEDIANRKLAIENATKYAIEIPLQVMRKSYESMEVMQAMGESGLPASISDAGVGALCARSAVLGAFLNVKINLGQLSDENYRTSVMKEATELAEKAKSKEAEILELVDSKL